MIATCVTGCGKKGDKDQKAENKSTDAEELLNEAQNIEKDYIFKQEDIEGVFENAVYTPYLACMGDKVNAVVISESSEVSAISLNRDGSDVKSFAVAIDANKMSGKYAYDNDGNLYVQYCEYERKDDMYDDNAKPTNIILLKYDGTGNELSRTDMKKELAVDDGFKVYTMYWTSKYGLVLQTSRGIETYDGKGGLNVVIDAKTTKAVLGEKGYYLCKGSGDQIFSSSYEDAGRKLRKVDLDNKKFGEPSSALGEGEYYSFYGGEGYDLYANDNESIYGYDAKTDKLVKLIDIEDSEIGGEYGITNIAALSEKEMFAIIPNSDMKCILSRLTKVRPEDVKNKTVLTVGGLFIDSDMNSFALRFNRSNDKYRIKIVDYGAGDVDSDVTTEDLVKQFNLDILSGKVPDIIYFNEYIDVNNYVDKGLLLDITSDFGKGGALGNIEILPNVFEMMHKNDKVYTVIPSFSIGTVVMRERYAEGKKTLTYNDCNDLIKGKHVDYKTAFGPCDQSEILYEGIIYGGDRYIDRQNKKCDFKNSDFIGLLNFSKEFPKEVDNSLYDEGREKFYTDDSELFDSTYFSDFFYSYGREKNALFKDDIAFVGFPNDAGVNEACIQPEALLGISSSTADKDGAIAFIKELFETEYVSDGGRPSFSSNKAVLENMMKEAMQEKYETVNGEKKPVEEFYSVGEDEIKAVPLTKDEVQKLYDYILSIKTMYQYDIQIHNIVQEEASAFFSGQKSAEEVADLVQNRVTTYINENK